MERKRFVLLLAQESRLEKKFSTRVNSDCVPDSSTNRSPPQAPAKAMVHRPNAIIKSRSSIIHPFAKALLEWSIIRKGRDEVNVTKELRILTDRTRQWASKLSFRLRSTNYALRPVLDARDVEHSYYASFLTDDGECPQFFDYKYTKNIRLYAPSMPMIRGWRLSHLDGQMLSPPASRVRWRIPREMVMTWMERRLMIL